MKIRNLLLCAVAALSLAACSKVPAGHVGVKVYLLGSSKGVDTEELGTGRYWIGWNEELYIFPTFMQNYCWTKDNTPECGSSNDESFSFQTKDGMVSSADIGISYNIDPSKVSDIFKTYRRGIDEITDTFLRNMVRDSLVKRSSALPVDAVYGEGKADLIETVLHDVQQQVGPQGINVTKLYWIGEIRLPDEVKAAINAKNSATQLAQQRQNEVAQAQAEARKIEAQAEGQAASIKVVAQAQAEANKILAESITPELVQYRAIEKWTGELPRYSGGGSVPFINITPENK